MPGPEVATVGATTESATLRGSLVWGHEIRSFRECGATEAAWVVDEADGRVRKLYEQLASAPYQELFFEVRGVRGPPVDEGFAADYAASVTVLEVRRAELEGRGCDDDLTAIEYRAAGTEPFWSLEISPAGLALSRPDPPGRVEWARRDPEAAENLLVFRSTDSSLGPIEVELTESACVDAMSGALFPLTAEVRLADEILHGCSLEGDLAQR